MHLDRVYQCNGHILLVEDDDKARRMLRILLAKAGYQVTSAADGQVALEQLAHRAAQGQPYDMVVTDIRLGTIDGLAVMQAARTQHPPSAVILLTGYGSLESAIAAIDAGASSYLLKPCKPPELLQRVDQALRHHNRELRRDQALQALTHVVEQLSDDHTPDSATISTNSIEPTSLASADHSATHERYLHLGELHIDTYHHEVVWGSRSITLTPTEYRLLSSLIAAGGRVLQYHEIVRMTHGFDTDNDEAYKLVKTHIHNLRRKIPVGRLVNVRGIGYRVITADEDS